MTTEELKASVACCGLVCCLCRPGCSCRDGGYAKHQSAQGCYQYTCCLAKGYQGCWECADAPCGKDMLAESHPKNRAFVACIQQDGLDAFARHLLQGQNAGLVYHRKGVIGDYDLQEEGAILSLLRDGASGDN